MLMLAVVPAHAAESALNLTPAQEACVKNALTPSEYQLFLVNPHDVALKGKVKACFTGGGSGTGTGSVAGGSGSSNAKVSKIPTSGKWITANPIDLSQVTSISVFRSCSGHDYSGTNTKGQAETDRSMKHYIQTNVPWTATDSIKGYAPFAGTVSITDEQFPLGKQLTVTSSVTGWQMVFFHGDPQVKSGAKVKAGQVITAWPPSNAPAVIDQLHQEGTSFDLAFRAYDSRYIDSPLLHMSPAVAKSWTAKGFTPARAIVSKSARDASPCNGNYNATDSTDFIRAN
ncbi:hypothetical protein LBMAG15_00080 [Actinomycetes bacterium]|nr:hypothetical protein LBMAG15_00080 [Actinomycetes bacterium]